MAWLHSLWKIILFVNTILALYVVFHRKRSVATTWAWLIVLLIFPVVGFILYGFLGRGLSQENLFAINRQNHIGLRKVQRMMPKVRRNVNELDTSDQAHILIDYIDSQRDAPLSKNNQIQLFTDGNAKFKALFKDIDAAKETINVEYYSFMNDKIGNEFLDHLIAKAKEGIKIRLIYDPWGSPGASKTWFKPLTDLGGEVLPFITSRNMIRKYRMNYHLHRKEVIIDGRISYTGGFNVGDQYLGRNKKFGNWRDTHVRIVGSASLLLQERFVMDWNASVVKPEQEIVFDERLFPRLSETKLPQNSVATQIVSDGPDKDEPYLRNGMMRLMLLARKTLWIQTPYLVPDDPMIATWLIAARSGVDVRIMIPCMPDHPFIYRATQWYAKQLMSEGIKIYIYQNGFLHAKTIMVDDNYAVVGSMNQDYRSYTLNFEANAIFYNKGVTRKMKEIFLDDCQESIMMTPQMVNEMSRYLRFKQSFSRLLSPIL